MDFAQVQKTLHKKEGQLKRAIARLDAALAVIAGREPLPRANGKAKVIPIDTARSEQKEQAKRGHEKPAVKAPNKGRQLQGKYMGLTRNLNKTQRAQVKHEKAEHGWNAAFALAKKLNGEKAR